MLIDVPILAIHEANAETQIHCCERVGSRNFGVSFMQKGRDLNFTPTNDVERRYRHSELNTLEIA